MHKVSNSIANTLVTRLLKRRSWTDYLALWLMWKIFSCVFTRKRTVTQNRYVKDVNLSTLS